MRTEHRPIAYAYDANGNTTSKTDSTGTTNYAWDYDDRLTNVTLPGSGGTVSYKYDPFGRRIYKSSSSGTSIYAYDVDNLIEETNSTGAVVARYAQTQDIDEPLAMLRSGTTSYYQADGLGTITSLSNAAGALPQTYTYDSFGNIVATTGSLTNSFRYTGREFDTETNLYYYRARYYDPSSGRFLSEDPVGFRGGVNFYSYVGNSPVFFVDPTGRYITPIGGPQDVKDLGLAIAYLLQDPVMAQILIQAMTDPNTEYVIDMRVGPADPYNWTKHKIHLVHWNPHLANRVCANGPYQSPALGLGHEIDHAVNGPDDESLQEEMRVINGSEAHAAKTLGEPRRYDHNDYGDKEVSSPVPKNWRVPR